MSVKRRSSGPTSRQSRLQYLRTVLLTALTAFGVAVYAWVPEWRHYVPLEQWTEQLSAQWGGSNYAAPSQPVPALSTHGSDQSVLQTKFAECPQFFVPGAMPVVPTALGLRELCFDAFAILHSGQRKTPVFVAQRLNRGMLQQAQKIQRTDRFYEEARLPSRDRAQLADYRGSGYSRGHMAPAADMHTKNSMDQSFSLANMVPQNQRHNGGPWAQIEQDTRKYIERARGDVYVFTGPVYEGRRQVIGDGKVAVPDYLYKVVYDSATQRAWVHWQANASDTRISKPISYEEFVRRTGLHLLPERARK